MGVVLAFAALAACMDAGSAPLAGPRADLKILEVTSDGPIRIGLDFVNGPTSRPPPSTGAGDPHFVVKDSHGKSAHRIEQWRGVAVPWPLTYAPPPPVGPGEVHAVLEDHDLRFSYLIVEPGEYTVQYAGSGDLPASGIERFTLTGPPRIQDQALAAIIDVLPEDWLVVNYGATAGDPSRWHIGVGKAGTGSRAGATIVTLSLGDQNINGAKRVGTYSGSPVHLVSPEGAEESWPGHERALLGALGIGE